MSRPLRATLAPNGERVFGGFRQAPHIQRGRGALHSWAFAQLKQLIVYKAALAGVPINPDVDPRNTPRQCPRCGHASRRKRPSQARFRCVERGHYGHADHIAAGNTAGRAAVNRPTSREMIPTVRIA